MQPPSVAPFFIGSYAWNFALGTSALVVPLYAHHLHMSGVEIGVLLGFPVVAQMLFSLVGGAFTDRLGGRAMQLLSFAAMTAAGLVFSVAHSFPPLLFGQLLLVVSRAVYWPASQTIASGLPGGAGVQLGRLLGVNNIGQISGTAAAGLLLAQWSFAAAFLALASMSAVAFVLAARSPLGRGGESHGAARAFVHFGPLLRDRRVYFSIACAYMAALPTSLSHSFYPILLVEFGFPSEAVGGLLSLRAAGAVAASVFVGRYLHSSGRHALPQAAMLGVAAGIGLIPLFGGGGSVAAFLLAAGVGSGIMSIYYQILMSEISTPASRGSALALGGLGWSLSHLTTPLAMGWLTDAVGIGNAFHVWGVFALVIALVFLPLQRWAEPAEA